MPTAGPVAAIALVCVVAAGLCFAVESRSTRRVLLALAALCVAVILLVYMLDGKVGGRG
jgi:hypothetical protein